MDVPAELVAILKRMDPSEMIQYFAKQGQIYVAERPNMTPKELREGEIRVILAAGHKTRNALGPGYFTIAELRESRTWLTTNGFRTGITKHRTH